MPKPVTNALSPEEKPIIENIISLFQQLLSLQEGAGTIAEEPPVEEVAEMAEEDDELDTNQAVDKTDVETGDSKAEERLDEQTDTTEQSMDDLKKTISSLQALVGAKTKTVAKSGLKNNVLLNEIKKISANLQSVVKAQKCQDELNKQLFDALGFSDEVIAKSMPEKKKEDQKPVQNITPNVMRDILAEVFKSIPNLNQNPETQHPFNQKRTSRENLKSIAQFIHNGR